MVTQLVTLLAVLLGSVSSYLATAAMERARYRRDLDAGWTERKLDAYTNYINDIKVMRGVARRMLRDTGFDPNLPIALPQEEGLPLLAEAEARRSSSAERVLLVGSEDVINALRALNQVVWRIERHARGLIKNADADTWNQTSSDFHSAMDNFQECARRDLRVPGSYVSR